MTKLRTEVASSSTSGHRYHFFISFRGKDTRKTFTDHLYTALVQAEIHTFKDEHELERGKNIKYELHKAIGESKIAVIVFSKGYASSEWCLDELVGILERKQAMGLTVIPVFYDVQPSDVRYQRGSFGEAFSMHEVSEFELQPNELMKKMDKWRATLREVADLGGMVLKNEADGYESKFIQEIVVLIKKNLNSTPNHYPSPTANPNPKPNQILIQYFERMLIRMVSGFCRYSRGFFGYSREYDYLVSQIFMFFVACFIVILTCILPNLYFMNRFQM